MALSDISFATSRKDFDLISKIIRRAITLTRHYDPHFDPQKETSIGGIRMDITAVHCNGCPLDLQKLLDFDNFNFLHDVGGILRNLNRATCELENSFLPRSAMPQSSRDAT